MLRKLFLSIRSVVWRNRLERDMDRELRFHLEMETEKNIKRGLPRHQARLEALRSFGAVEKVKDECRDEKGVSFFDALWQDLRYGLRVLWKRPAFTLIALVVLALGIGANTAIFSVVYGVLLRPLPYERGEEIVFARQQAPQAGVTNLPFSVKELTDYREQNQTFQSLVEYHSMSFILYGRGVPKYVTTGVVSHNFFDVLGVKPLLGRTFLAEDEQKGAEAALVLSYKYWRESYGGDPTIIGEKLQMNDRPHVVIGVLPPIPQYPQENDVYMPTTACPTRSSQRFVENRNARMMNVFGRLRPGVKLDEARADFELIAARLKEQYPESYPDSRGYGVRLMSLKEELTRQARPTFLILLGTAGLVLLIACANVANLTLAHLMRRERELAIRAALGAGRRRLIRQLLTESALLALGGGILGILFAAGGLHLLVSFAARFTTRAAEIEIDSWVLAFTLIISVLTGILFGLLPALAMRGSVTSSMREGGQTTAGPRRHRLRSALLVSQVAVSFVLLIGAGLMVRSLLRLQQVEPGFDPEGVLTMNINLNWSKYNRPEQTRDFFTRLVRKVQESPGVSSAAVASTFPMDQTAINFGPFNRNIQIEGRSVEPSESVERADFRIASSDYFKTIRLPLVKGRYFTESDKEEAPRVALINQSMARHRWADEDPIGKRVSLDQGETWLTIVGVVGDVKQYGPDKESTDELYTPFAQTPGARSLLIRTSLDPMSLARQTEKDVYEIDPEVAITDVRALEQARDETLASPRLMTTLLLLFAGLALIITTAGIAGVIALSVSQRTNEIGIRMAMGATPAKVIWSLVRQGLLLVTVGLALGLIGAFFLSSVLRGLLFNVQPTDFITYATVSFVLIVTAAVACFLPARKATGIDPILALRAD
ncbi:MAG TPA: ABC transporter permease [Blastocatellia bacterium]